MEPPPLLAADSVGDWCLVVRLPEDELLDDRRLHDEEVGDGEAFRPIAAWLVWLASAGKAAPEVLQLMNLHAPRLWKIVVQYLACELSAVSPRQGMVHVCVSLFQDKTADKTGKSSERIFAVARLSSSESSKPDPILEAVGEIMGEGVTRYCTRSVLEEG